MGHPVFSPTKQACGIVAFDHHVWTGRKGPSDAGLLECSVVAFLPGKKREQNIYQKLS